jgi:integrase
VTGVCQKGGSTYRRFKIKGADGKWRDQYVKLPDPSDPRFAEELARVNTKQPVRQRAAYGTMAGLVAELRIVLSKRKMADATRADWNYYLGLIEEQHGRRLVAQLERHHCYKIRNGMAETPGKANVYMAKLKGLLEFASEIGWIRDNPAKGIPLFEVGEHSPWPREVLAEALAAAGPMDRLIIITGLCSGQRASDAIRIPRKFDGGMIQLRSKKTDQPAAIVMHPMWRAEIDRTEAKAVTVLYDHFGRPFTDPKTIQARIRRLMKRLGYVDERGAPLYSFHGLSKNAICYLTELGLDEGTIGALVGKTAETVRHYAKEARLWMLAERAAGTVIAGRIERLVGKSTASCGKAD